MQTISEIALERLSHVPEDRFLEGSFSNGLDKCCSIGHFNRMAPKHNPLDYSKRNCMNNAKEELQLREASRKFLKAKIKSATGIDISVINNYPLYGPYNEPVIKDRVIHLLTDMVNAGY